MNTGHLTRDLEREADQFARRGGTTLDLSQVLDRAGEIRRGRRMRATMVMAACVLAIAVPTVLVAVNRDATHEPAPAPAPKVDSSPLSLDGLTQGDAPHLAYLQSGSLHRDGFTYTSQGNRYVDLAEYSDGVLVATRDETGKLTVHVGVMERASRLRAMDHLPSWPIEGGFTVSADGNLVAFVQPDGTPVVLSSGATGDPQVAYTLPRIPRGSGFDAVAVDGQGCRPTEFPCRVWVTSHGSRPETWVSTSGEAAPTTRPGFRSVTDVDSTESTIAGIIDVRPDLTTCSAVERSTQPTPIWTTCDHRLLRFAPDDGRLLATGSVGDGLGDTQLAVLDAATGKVELDLKTADQALIGQMSWEDSDHVLATVFQDGKWAVLRIGLDGEREYAVAPAAGEDMDSPLVLPSR